MSTKRKRIRAFFVTTALFLTFLSSAFMAERAKASISWDGEGNSNWWFDPLNWSGAAGDNYLPPNNASGVLTDAQINMGDTGAWNVTGEGVVYDPDNDPFFAAASGYSYPADSSPITTYVGTNYGPEHLYRMYVGRNVTDGSTNLLTIKSGDLAIANTFILGRSGSTAGNENLGIIVQEGGRIRSPLSPIDIGQGETSGWGNGTYDYRGGIAEFDLEGSNGIRLAHGGGNGQAGGTGTFIMHNSSSGYVRSWRYQSASWRGTVDADVTIADPDGITTGVAISEFHYENGGTRPIQILNNLSINNGFQSDTQGTTSSRLNLVLDEAACRRVMAAFLMIWDFSTSILEVFMVGLLRVPVILEEPSPMPMAAAVYSEGSTVSANFGGVRYDWTISYSGDISWNDADAGDVGTILGAGNGVDVVLMGLGSESVGIAGDYDNDGDVDGRDFLVWQRGGSPNGTTAGDLQDWQNNYGTGSPLAAIGAVPEPTSLVLLCATALPLFGRRRAG